MIMPPVTKNLIIINVLMFFATWVVGQTYGIDLSYYLGLHLFLGQGFNPAQLITYMFMHADFQHLFFNMFAVFMFGRLLEQVWGSKRFLFYYLFCGIGAGVVQEVVQLMYVMNTGGAYSITVGASGAVFAILLAFGMLFPNQQIFIFPLPVPIKAKIFVVGYAILELYLGVSNKVGDNVAHFAHLGGMIFGIILILYWRNQNKRRNPHAY